MESVIVIHFQLKSVFTMKIHYLRDSNISLKEFQLERLLLLLTEVITENFFHLSNFLLDYSEEKSQLMPGQNQAKLTHGYPLMGKKAKIFLQNLKTLEPRKQNLSLNSKMIR